MSTNQNAPIGHLRVGSIEVAIWENEGQYGPQYSTTLKRKYLREELDQATGEMRKVWDETGSIPFSELLNAAKALDLAYNAIHRRKELIRAQRDQAAAGTAQTSASKPATAAKPAPTAPALSDAQLAAVAEAVARATAAQQQAQVANGNGITRRAAAQPQTTLEDNEVAF